MIIPAPIPAGFALIPPYTMEIPTDKNDPN